MHTLSFEYSTGKWDNATHICIYSTDKMAGTWIGLRTNGPPHVAVGFKWNFGDGTVTYTNYNPGQPRNLKDEFCIELRPSFSYRWNNYPCHHATTFVCEMPHTVTDTKNCVCEFWFLTFISLLACHHDAFQCVTNAVWMKTFNIYLPLKYMLAHSHTHKGTHTDIHTYTPPPKVWHHIG